MRAEKRAERNNPINFTCGVCAQVHPFDSENPYDCPEDLVNEALEQEI